MRLRLPDFSGISVRIEREPPRGVVPHREQFYVRTADIKDEDFIGPHIRLRKRAGVRKAELRKPFPRFPWFLRFLNRVSKQDRRP